MSVSYTISLEEELKSGLAKFGKRLDRAYSNEFINELGESAVRSIINGGSFEEVQTSLTPVFDANANGIKDRAKQRISTRSRTEWSGLANEASLNGTHNQTVNQSFNSTKKQMRIKVDQARLNYNKLKTFYNQDKIESLKKLGITGKNEKELLLNIQKKIANDIGDLLGGVADYKEKMLITTEAQQAKYTKFKKRMLVDLNPVKWVTAADERVCPICAPRDQVVYKDINEAPPFPAHPSCRCELEEADKKELR